MSHDLSVYAARAPTAGTLSGLIESIEGLRADPARDPSSGSMLVERSVRGGHAPVATLDGPLRVEIEDLPDAVRAAAVGITALYQLSGPASPAVLPRLANRVARALAAETGGVVFDPQSDAVTWPRGGTRKVAPCRETRIDVVGLRWFVRREDRPEDLPEAIHETIRTHLPEALPRRFGGHEPLQHRLDEVGAEGFGRAWRDEAMMLFFRGRRPCLAGSMSGLGAPSLRPDALPHPVGTLELSLLGEALSDARWRRDVVRLFVALIERTNAFFALADVERGVGFSGGSLWYDADSVGPPGLVVRDEWMGLPPHECWLTWIGPLYPDLLREPPSRLPGVSRVGDGALVRSGEEPPGTDRPGPFPADLVMRFSPGKWGTRDRRRAARVPEGL